MPKALAMISGGLDSTLAAALLLEQGVPVHGLTFVSLFTAAKSPKGDALQSVFAARKLGIPITVVNWSRRFVELVKGPRYGYGRNMNPCIDCRLEVLSMARQRMDELECDFAITGEVLGERPMSQRRQPMDMVRARSGLGELLLRPLSAKLLEPTLPEREGWVDRSRLLGLQGRSRTPQIALAQRLGITEYPTPAGGCLLTDPAFSVRLRDLLAHVPDFSLNDAHLLKVGRWLRLSAKVRLAVGRNHSENRILRSFARDGDTLLLARDFSGPVALVRGDMEERHRLQAARVTALYGKGRTQPEVVVEWRTLGAGQGQDTVPPAQDQEIAVYRLPQPQGMRRAE